MFKKLAAGFKKFLACVIIFPLLRILFRVLDSLRAGSMRDVGLLLVGEKSIYLARQKRALASTVEYVEKYMPHVESAKSKPELLTRAFGMADVSDDRLICEFGVFKGESINHVAGLTQKTLYGFDSFKGLAEEWGDTWKKGDFVVRKLPQVRRNVTLVQGWFNETLPPFLREHSGKVGFLHIDCDLYSSCKTIFELMESRLVPGTVIVFDEYFNYPQWEDGEFKAFQEFLAKTKLSCEFIGYHRNGEQAAVILK
jgi:predicted O-methyltransferase YrrM